jgi:heme/copper-type cytochrome/quinol oxidase subunit 2
MTSSGWIIMFISVLGVSALLLWCIIKVLKSPEEAEHLHGFEQETPDIEGSD